MSPVKPYKYFDTPSGYDVDKKFMCLMKPTFVTAATLGFGDVFLFSKPKGYGSIITRVVYLSSPLFASSLSFLLVTNGLAGIRKKDDKLNWFLGGFSAGTIFGAFRGNGMLGFNLGMAFGAMAFIRKMAAENNFELIPPYKLYHDGPIATDWTLTKHIPGNWTTGEK